MRGTDIGSVLTTVVVESINALTVDLWNRPLGPGQHPSPQHPW